MSVSAQDILGKNIFESVPSESKEMLDFLRDSGVTLSRDQREAITLLRVEGGADAIFDDVIDCVMSLRASAMPTKVFRQTMQELSKAMAASKNSSMVSVLESKK
ncbi:hypothetical protein [Brevibacillus formosus]|uniref:hypothetical protein n=1 Tax=Brevibacillus formosus TaxID=54913 RepID=UPI003F19473B